MFGQYPIGAVKYSAGRVVTGEKWWCALGERFMQLWGSQPHLSTPSGALSSDELGVQTVEMEKLDSPLPHRTFLQGGSAEGQRPPLGLRSETSSLRMVSGERLRVPALTRVCAVALGKPLHVSEPLILCRCVIWAPLRASSAARGHLSSSSCFFALSERQKSVWDF